MKPMASTPTALAISKKARASGLAISAIATAPASATKRRLDLQNLVTRWRRCVGVIRATFDLSGPP